MAATIARIADRLTIVIKRAADVLFAHNPFMTSMGICAGIVADGFVKISLPSLRHYDAFVDLSRLSLPYCVAAGVFLFNLPWLLRSWRLFKEIEEALAVVDRMRGTLTEAQVRMQYLAVCSRALTKIREPTAKPAGPSPA